MKNMTTSKRPSKRTSTDNKKIKPIEMHTSFVTEEEATIRRDLEAFFKNGKAVRAPNKLGKVARKKWNEIMAGYMALEIDVLNVLDITQLVLYCQSYERYYVAQKTWTEDLGQSFGTSSPTKNRQIKQCLSTMREETTTMTRLAPDLCLTPTGRARFGLNSYKAVKEERANEKDSFKSFIKSIGEETDA